MRDQIAARDTIFALSSGSLPSGVGVIRISGPESANLLKQLTGSVPEPRFARLVSLTDMDGNLIDRGLGFYFKAPASFTGEDCVEFQVHGGKAVIAKLLKTLGKMPGLRGAEAGEFTRRAYLNGKLDLANAEALSDLISAETEAQRRFAIANTTDRHRQLYDAWRRQLIEARALIEAELDFSDEGDVPGSVSDLVWSNVKMLYKEVQQHVASYHDAEIIRDGLQVVILGAPNAGKSSLLNSLARRDVAIVTDEAGTTRDILEIHLDLGGMKVTLADTAGIREAAGNIEAIGIKRSLERAYTADLILHIEDMANPVSFSGAPSIPTLRIGNKVDLLHGTNIAEAYDCIISTQTGEGIDHLITILRERTDAYLEKSTSTLPFRSRHIDLLNDSLENIQSSLDESDLELAAERLRIASTSLARICGEIDVEDLLDTIFSSFCIGK